MLGDRNWWIPRWLDRKLPRIDVEGRVEADTSADIERPAAVAGTVSEADAPQPAEG